MPKLNNTFKACALFVGVLLALYGTKNVNQWRSQTRDRGQEDYTELFQTGGFRFEGPEYFETGGGMTHEEYAGGGSQTFGRGY